MMQCIFSNLITLWQKLTCATPIALSLFTPVILQLQVSNGNSKGMIILHIFMTLHCHLEQKVLQKFSMVSRRPFEFVGWWQDVASTQSWFILMIFWCLPLHSGPVRLPIPPCCSYFKILALLSAGARWLVLRRNWFFLELNWTPSSVPWPFHPPNLLNSMMLCTFFWLLKRRANKQ